MNSYIMSANVFLDESIKASELGKSGAEVTTLRMTVRAILDYLESQQQPQPAPVEVPDVVRCACGVVDCAGAIMRSDDNEITVRSMGGNETVVMLNVTAIDQLITMLQSMKAAQEAKQ